MARFDWNYFPCKTFNLKKIKSYGFKQYISSHVLMDYMVNDDTVNGMVTYLPTLVNKKYTHLLYLRILRKIMPLHKSTNGYHMMTLIAKTQYISLSWDATHHTMHLTFCTCCGIYYPLSNISLIVKEYFFIINAINVLRNQTYEINTSILKLNSMW